MAKPTPSPAPSSCSFCLKRPETRNRMILGLSVAICFRCIRRLAAQVEASGAEDLDAVRPILPANHPLASVASPKFPSKQGIDFEIFDARSQAARIIAEAEHEAQEIRRLARQEAERLAEEARRKGYEQGLAEGRAARPLE